MRSRAWSSVHHGTVLVPWASRSRTIRFRQMDIIDLHPAGFDLFFVQGRVMALDHGLQGH